MDRRGFLLGMAVMVATSAGQYAAAANGNGAMPRPPKRTRPLVAIVADNRGTETTDLMIPQAILARSGLADVVVVAPESGDIALMPALTIAAQQTLDAFDRAHPDGADYVIVPAFHHDDRRGPVVDWLKRQADSGAIIVGICEGAKVLGRAGLLDGRKATTHWYAADSLRSTYPTMRWTPQRRYVIDGGIVTTTGVTASLPASLALVEAIGGAAPARELAGSIGIADYGDAHPGDRYRLDAGRIWRIVANSAAVWRHETAGIPAGDGIDGIALALTADAWSRTFRSQAIAIGTASSAVTREGLHLRLAGQTGRHKPDWIIRLDDGLPSAMHLDLALAAISSRYGDGTADLVALQLEYPWPDGLGDMH